MRAYTSAGARVPGRDRTQILHRAPQTACSARFNAHAHARLHANPRFPRGEYRGRALRWEVPQGERKRLDAAATEAAQDAGEGVQTSIGRFA